MLLKDKVAFVTGGSKGIGKAIVRRYLEEGAHVFYFSRSQNTEHEMLKGISEKNEVRFEYLSGEVSNQTQIQDAIKHTQNETGRLDILINNAGITKDKLFIAMNKEDWDDVLDINLTSIYYTSKVAVPFMLKQKSGVIINMSSVVAITGNAGQTNYSASKAGMIGFTKSLALELAKKNIRVNAIAPGFINTEMTDKIPDEYRKKILEQIPMQKEGQPNDIANACVFFGSSLANYITGQVLTVSGGL